MLPEDPMMLLSCINTGLRDKYHSPEEMYEDLDVDGSVIEEKLIKAGYQYNAGTNQYRPAELYILRKAGLSDCNVVTELALLLWPENTFENLYDEMSGFLQNSNAVAILCENEGEAMGFALCQLRFDYVEGTESSPVGYLEGIFVKETYRRKGIAGKLLKNCEDWSMERGCTEFASDCEFENITSYDFHINTGFDEANRIICFTKKIVNNTDKANDDCKKKCTVSGLEAKE